MSGTQNPMATNASWAQFDVRGGSKAAPTDEWAAFDPPLPVPPIPPGTDEALAAEAAALLMPNGFTRHTGKIDPGTLPTTDEVRAAVEKWSVPEGPSIMGMMKNTLLGAMDIGQVVGSGGTRGRVMMDDSGNPLSIRSTPEITDAIGLGAGMSPARGTGRAIAETSEYGAPLAELYARNRPAPPVAAPATPLVTALQRGMPAEIGPVQSAAVPSPARLADALAAGEPRTAGTPTSLTVLPETLAAGERRSAGAAGTPTSLTVLPPREAAASRATGERSQLMETPQPGDATVYVPGVNPTLAEIKQNAAVSREAKTLRTTNPTEIAERAKNNSELYADFYNDMAGTASMVQRAKDVRQAQADRDLALVWPNKMKADIQPVLDVAKAIKASPDGNRPLIRSKIAEVTAELYDDAGKVITDPEQLYGVRKHINDLLSKEAQRKDPLNVLAEATLLSLKASLTDVIEAAAPGFKKYLANFEAASRPIDAMTKLQEDGLFRGANREVTFNQFDVFMRDLAADRAAKGVNPAKSIDDATWENLVAMHKSLQRTAGAELLARAPGSDTATNLYDMSKLGIRAAAHAAGAVLMPGLGNVAAHLGANYLDKRSAAARLAKHMDPDLSKYPNYDNPFARGLTNFPNNQTGP